MILIESGWVLLPNTYVFPFVFQAWNTQGVELQAESFFFGSIIRTISISFVMPKLTYPSFPFFFSRRGTLTAWSCRQSLFFWDPLQELFQFLLHVQGWHIPKVVELNVDTGSFFVFYIFYLNLTYICISCMIHKCLLRVSRWKRATWCCSWNAAWPRHYARPDNCDCLQKAWKNHHTCKAFRIWNRSFFHMFAMKWPESEQVHHQTVQTWWEHTRRWLLPVNWEAGPCFCNIIQ